MTAPPRERCPRRWEVSAAHDGRLLQKDLESLNRHVSGCESCQHERERIEALAQGLRQLAPLRDDLLAARRLRHKVLAEANGLIVAAAPQRQVWRWVGTGALFVAAATALVLVRRGGVAATAPVAQQPAKASVDAIPVEVAATTGAVWQKYQATDELRIDLSAGEIVAKIGPRRGGERVRIQLPDGWIDDLGTTLSVRVEGGHTTSVRVSEGRVLLQLHGRESRELNAGESWERSGDPVASGVPHAPPPSVHSAAKAASAALSPAPSPSTANKASSSNAAGGARADGAVGRSAREEDELYLHIVALSRAHQLSEARAAAKQYLARFPNGFRHDEVSVVANQ